MAKLAFVRAAGALILSTALLGCASTASRQQSAAESEATREAAHRLAKQDRTPSWQKYHVSGSRIARRMDASGRPLSADFVKTTTPKGVEMLPGVTMTPCEKTRSDC
jgi:hypothetical protein